MIHLRRLLQRLRSRDGREIFVAQFQLERACKESALAQAPPDHFAEAHQRGLQALGIARVFIEGVLVADRFRIDVFSHFIVEPSSRILAPRLTSQRETPFSEALFEIAVFKARQVAHFLNAVVLQSLLHDFSDARDLPHVERSKKRDLPAGQHE